MGACPPCRRTPRVLPQRPDGSRDTESVRAGALATIARSGVMLQQWRGCGVALAVGGMLVLALCSSVGAQPQALPATPGPSATEQRLNSVSELSDTALREVYLHKPWLLPPVITNAEWERIMRLAHPKLEEETVPPAQVSPQREEPAKQPPPGGAKKRRGKTSVSRP